MRIRRSTGIVIIFAVVFVVANIVALPFANFGTYSALWAQVYGNSEPSLSCPDISDFSRLNDTDAASVLAAFPVPTPDSKLEAVYVTCGFGIHGVALSDFAIDGLTCANAVAYRIEENGNRQLWPISCDDAGTGLLIPGTGERGHIELFKVADPASAPVGIVLTHGA